VVVLSDSHFNRPHAAELRGALGEHYAAPPGALVGAQKAGQPLPGSGVLLI